MLAADTMEALGIARGDYVIKVSNRKILDGLRDVVGLAGQENDSRWLTVMRAVDKMDRLGANGVRALLGEGRKDESGDFTKGAGLAPKHIDIVLHQLEAEYDDETAFGDEIQQKLNKSMLRTAGLSELVEMRNIYSSAGYNDGRILINFGIVRGLEYYTGPVFEAELTFEVKDEKGNPVRFGSVGGGGRYDDLVARFTGQKVPATGFSIGVSRLQAALEALGSAKTAAPGPVVVTVMEKERIADYQKMVQTLRNAGISAELYLGNPKKFGKQLEYADRRGSPCVVIQGSDERAKGEVTLKDLIEGARAAAAIKGHEEWKETRPAQVSVKEKDLVNEVRRILARHR
jgi:histidyl-tRNA synthetase